MRTPGSLFGDFSLGPRVATTARRVPTVSYRQTVVNDKASGYWPLLETTGSTAVDVIGTANGTYTGGYSLGTGVVTPTLGACVVLDGTDDYIAVADNILWSALGSAGRLAVEAWIKPSAVNRSAAMIVAKHQEWQLRIESNGTILWDVNNNGASTIGTCSSSALSAGQVYHVVANYDRPALTVQLYVNGALSSSAASLNQDTTNTTNDLRIGGRSDNGGNEFIGAIAHVAIYPRPLTATQVRRHYRAGTEAQIL